MQTVEKLKVVMVFLGVLVAAFILNSINVLGLEVKRGNDIQAAAVDSPIERVLPVIGRVTFPFDGLGAEVGFLVKDGDHYMLARYDQGSMASNPNWQPKFMIAVRDADGQLEYQPLLLEEFK